MSAAGSRRAVAAAGAALVLLAVLPYVGSLGYPLLQDDRTALDNRWLREEADAGNVWFHDYWHGTRHEDSDLYRPVTVLSLAWNLRMAEGRLGIRVVNPVLHAGVTLLIWLLLSRILAGLEGVGERRVPVAWTGAALFAVHPLASEAVILTVGRSELLAAIFGLAALALLLRPGPGSPMRHIAPAVLFALALLSKESAASWIVILIVWCRVSSLRGPVDRRVLCALPYWGAALVLYLLLRGSVVGWLPHERPWVDNPLVLEGHGVRVVNAVRLLGLYLGKMLWPFRLSLDYGFNQLPPVGLVSWGGFGAAAAIALWWVVLRLLQRLTAAGVFLWAFVPCAFAVTANIATPIGTIFAERLAYLPLVGFCGLVACLLWRWPLPRALTIGVVVLLLAAGGWRTVVRTHDFRSHTALVEATAAASPNAVKALVNAGRSRLRRDRPEEALVPLRRAVEIWPDYPRALGLLGDLHATLGDEVKADEYRRRAQAAFEKLQAAEPR